MVQIQRKGAVSTFSVRQTSTVASVWSGFRRTGAGQVERAANLSAAERSARSNRGFDPGTLRSSSSGTALSRLSSLSSPIRSASTALNAIANPFTGKSVEHSVTTGTVTITKDNLQEPETRKALYTLKCD